MTAKLEYEDDMINYDDRRSQWRIISERVIHDSPWMKLAIADVELPNGKVIEHRIVRYPAPTAGVLLHDRSAQTVLLVWRHRFITKHWGWEIPAGLADPGEAPMQAAVREAAEETGYKAVDPVPLVEMDTSSGLMDETFYCFYASEWSEIQARDADIETSRIAWIAIGKLDQLIAERQVRHAHSLVSLLKAQHDGLLA